MDGLWLCKNEERIVESGILNSDWNVRIGESISDWIYRTIITSSIWSLDQSDMQWIVIAIDQRE